MYEIFRKICFLFISIKFKKRVYNSKNIPRNLKKGGCIIAANHQNYYDPVVIAAMFKGKFSFMAKAELFKNKLFAALIRFCGAFPVVRGAGDNKGIETALESLNNKRVFVIFPEGSRSKDGTIGRARSGVALIAAQANAPVIPVCIMYGLAGEKRRLDFAIGEPISPAALDVGSGERENIKRVSGLIINSIKSLQQEIFENIDNAKKVGNNSEI